MINFLEKRGIVGPVPMGAELFLRHLPFGFCTGGKNLIRCRPNMRRNDAWHGVC